MNKERQKKPSDFAPRPPDLVYSSDAALFGTEMGTCYYLLRGVQRKQRPRYHQLLMKKETSANRSTTNSSTYAMTTPSQAPGSRSRVRSQDYAQHAFNSPRPGGNSHCRTTIRAGIKHVDSRHPTVAWKTQFRHRCLRASDLSQCPMFCQSSTETYPSCRTNRVAPVTLRSGRRAQSVVCSRNNCKFSSSCFRIKISN